MRVGDTSGCRGRTIRAEGRPEHDADTGAGRADDARRFRDALGRFATGVTVVAAVDPSTASPVGLTVNSFASVSLDPPLVLWSVGCGATCYPLFQPGLAFTVNVLTTEQLSLARAFARSGHDPWPEVRWHPGPGGAPLIDDSLAWFECVVTARHPGGDHAVVVAEVRHFERGEGEPLVFYAGEFTRLGAPAGGLRSRCA